MQTPPPPPSPSPQPLSVLVADDEEDIRVVLVQLLERRGYDVVSAATGLQAMERVSRATDLIVADILMPDGDGLDLIRHARHANPAVRILAISGGAQFAPAGFNTNLAVQLGADAALLKPFTGEQFEAAIDQLVAPRTGSGR